MSMRLFVRDVLRKHEEPPGNQDVPDLQTHDRNEREEDDLRAARKNPNPMTFATIPTYAVTFPKRVLRSMTTEMIRGATDGGRNSRRKRALVDSEHRLP